MAYIGRDTDKISNVEVLDNITFDGSSSYTLQKNSVNFIPSSANTLLLSIDGVVQAGNFTVSSSTIDFGTAVAGTSTCDFILHYGVGLITAPSDGTVTTAKLADSSVSLAKLTATGTKDATTFLRGDNTFNTPPNTGITVADQWRLTANLSGTDTIITSNLEQVDTSGQGTLGSAMTVSSGVFTFPSTGIYLILFKAATSNTVGDETQFQLICNVTTNNSSYTEIAEVRTSARPEHNNQSAMGSTLVDVTDTSNVKVKFSTASHQADTILNGNTTKDTTSFTFIRLGDT